MSWPRIIERLDRDEIVEIRPSGNSMTPLIKSKQLVRLERWPPINPRSPVAHHVEVGMIVLAKVKGRFYLHKITACAGRFPDWDRVEISNNHGHVNGWTTLDKIYAVVTSVE